ncbi:MULTISPECIES: hypothetical protein [unclassified Pseudomonas]|uniref:hypothetical protein n=1 Tax=unclassified Pseudomonas TaxID=196821 RepID=UPI001B322B95|nr:hypothetical protein [Pseudomonas sp. Tri1]
MKALFIGKSKDITQLPKAFCGLFLTLFVLDQKLPLWKKYNKRGKHLGEFNQGLDLYLTSYD